MKKLLMTMMLAALSSCGAFDTTIEKGVDGGKELVTHATEEIGKLKTEVLEEVRVTIEEVMPVVVETALNADGVAFLIVAVTGLLGLVVITALVVILRLMWNLWRRRRA